MSKKTQKAVTLVELVVVIAIIAIGACFSSEYRGNGFTRTGSEAQPRKLFQS